MPTFAGVEGGGTTFVCCLGEPVGSSESLRITDRAEFPTRIPPSETIAEVVAWLQARKYDALGVACFGPIDLDPASRTWGYITTTPKLGWQYVDIMGPLKAVRDVPCGFDTDVNAPALEEFRHFAQPGETSCAYVTVGTGIGVGLVVNGRSVRGLIHPEGGHIPTLKRRADDMYPGVTTLHPWSVEAQCSAGALAQRAASTPENLKDLPDDSEVWADAAWMLGSLCATLCALVSVERIVLSGGVMQRLSLFPKVREATRKILQGYIQHPKVLEDGPQGIDGYIVPSVRGNDAGIFGALALAADAYKEAKGCGSRGTASTDTPQSSMLSISPCTDAKERALAPAAEQASARVALAAAAASGAALGAAAVLLAVAAARRRRGGPGP